MIQAGVAVQVNTLGRKWFEQFCLLKAHKADSCSDAGELQLSFDG